MHDSHSPVRLLRSFLDECASRGLWPPLKLAEIDAGAEILAASPERQVRVAREAVRQIVNSRRGMNARELVSRLLRRRLPISSGDLIDMLRSTVRIHDKHLVPWSGLLKFVEEIASRGELTPDLARALETARDSIGIRMLDTEMRRVRDRIEAVLAPPETDGDERGFGIDPGEPWSDVALDALARLQPPEREAWRAVVDHVATAKGARPTKKWLGEAARLLGPIGGDAFARRAAAWLARVGERSTLHPRPPGTEFIDQGELIGDRNADVLKGLAWFAGLVDDERLARAVGHAAAQCFKKLRNWGPRSPRVANACTIALAMMPGDEPLAQLARLKTIVRAPSSRAQVEKALASVAEREGVAPEDLEERGVPGHGLSEVGRLERRVGAFRFELTMPPGGGIEQRWVGEDGALRKSTPSAVRDEFPGDLAELKRVAKELQKTFAAVRHRLESAALRRRAWPLEEWRRAFLDHPVVGALARRLVWRFVAGAARIEAAWSDRRLVGVDDDPLGDLPPETTVRPWHPIGEAVADVVAWREWLERHRVTQPFKQAHREVYVLTQAERQTGTYSNRFAAHVLKQHQFAALCRERGWRYELQGEWDSHNTPWLDLPHWGLRAEFWVEGVHGSEISSAGVFLTVSSDQVRFCEAGADDPVPLEDVPPIVFTEVMRDVDLFVGVSSIASDPNWIEQGERLDDELRAYWLDTSFGELNDAAKTRREVLERLLPRLTIADRCELGERFLVVRGDLRTYKIHLGSTNILMEPNDQYLCIVPGRTMTRAPAKVYLPFEGDTALSVILSKAMLLAADAEISDPTIREQIGG